MKTVLSVLMVTLLVTFLLPAPAFAMEHQPAGACPPRFELHHFMDHTGDHMHTHIGVAQDLNGDGYVCMKVLTNDLHLHVDNYLRLP